MFAIDDCELRNSTNNDTRWTRDWMHMSYVYCHGWPRIDIREPWSCLVVLNCDCLRSRNGDACIIIYAFFRPSQSPPGISNFLCISFSFDNHGQCRRRCLQVFTYLFQLNSLLFLYFVVSYSLTVFSPSGKLVQIEHALAAVSQGTTSLGIKGTY